VGWNQWRRWADTIYGELYQKRFLFAFYYQVLRDVWTHSHPAAGRRRVIAEHSDIRKDGSPWSDWFYRCSIWTLEQSSKREAEFLDAMKEKLIGKDIKYKIRIGLGQDDI